MKRTTKRWMQAAKGMAASVLVATAGLAQALPFSAFEGRNADGSVNNTCTATGATKCVMIYDSTLDITILNDWFIGGRGGFWSATAAPGSAQALAETAGFNATGLTGWRLPTGERFQPAGAQNEYLSIWNDVNGTLAGLQSEFDGVQTASYISGSEVFGSFAWYFSTTEGFQWYASQDDQLFAVAVRSGDVVAAVPEPESLALVLVGLVAAGVARRRPL